MVDYKKELNELEARKRGWLPVLTGRKWFDEQGREIFLGWTPPGKSRLTVNVPLPNFLPVGPLDKPQ